MARNCGIEWVQGDDGSPGSSWNPVRGCTRVSPGCGGPGNAGGCYAERIAARFSGPGKPFEGIARMTSHGARWTGKVRLIEEHLDDPVRWQRPRRIFVNSMSDLFHEKVPLSWVQKVFEVMLRTPRHSYQVLTKRHERMAELLPQVRLLDGRLWSEEPAKHIWIGVSAEDQQRADERIPALAATPAAVRMVSVEPLLAPVNLRGLLHGISWVIAGCESGPGARDMDLDWVRRIRDDCMAAGTRFFFKQKKQDGKVVGLPELDGKVWAEYPSQVNAEVRDDRVG